MSYINDERYTSQTDERAVLFAWAGRNDMNCSLPMGGWLDDDSDAFLQAVRQQHIDDIGHAIPYISIVDADGDEVDSHSEPATVPALRVVSVCQADDPDVLYCFDVEQVDGKPVGELWLKATRAVGDVIVVDGWGDSRRCWCSDEAAQWNAALEELDCFDGFDELFDVCAKALAASGLFA